VAQREPVRGELLLEHGPQRPAWHSFHDLARQQGSCPVSGRISGSRTGVRCSDKIARAGQWVRGVVRGMWCATSGRMRNAYSRESTYAEPIERTRDGSGHAG